MPEATVDLIDVVFELARYLDVWLTALLYAASLGVSLLIVGGVGVVWPRFRRANRRIDNLTGEQSLTGDLLRGDR